MKQGRETTLEERIQIAEIALPVGKTMEKWLWNSGELINGAGPGHLGLSRWVQPGWKIGVAAEKKTRLPARNWKKPKSKSSNSSTSCIWQKWKMLY